MIEINVKADIKDAVRYLDNVQRKQIPFATSVALNETAKDVQAATYDQFRKSFDRPTPIVMKSLRIKYAKKTDLTAMVFMKDKGLGGKNANSMAEILGHEFSGGSRIHKKIEFVLQQWKFISTGEYVVPGAAARMDKYGNMSRGQIVQILSQIGVKQAGYDSNPTGSKRSKRNVAKAGTIFWSRGPEGKRIPLVDKATGIKYGYTGGNASRLAKGAWIRDGRSVHPILLVVKSTRYRKRIDMQRIAQPVIDKKFRIHFVAAIDRAMATAR
jgi:hypothetical protein